MKKTEIYNIAMDAVLDSSFSNEVKLEVIEVLMTDRTVAKYAEKAEETK